MDIGCGDRLGVVGNGQKQLGERIGMAALVLKQDRWIRDPRGRACSLISLWARALCSLR